MAAYHLPLLKPCITMNKNIVTTSVILRILLGWYMFFAGIEKVLNPDWTASGFLSSAKTFPALYAWLGSAGNMWWIDPLNAWGITLIGVALILGVGVRLASWGGAALMILYYFPHYAFPFVLEHGFIVEEHVINAAAFILVGLMPEAQRFSLAGPLKKTFLGKVPLIRSLL